MQLTSYQKETAVNTERTADTEAVEAVIRDTVAAWNAGDATAYGACFTADATYVTWVGTRYQGRQEIARAHAALFRMFLKGSTLADEIVAVRFIGPDAAIVSSNGDVVKGGKRPEGVKLTKAQTYTIVREADGHWRIASFHNTKHKALMERISFAFAPETMPAGA
ncbi:SgcJ/EcaC family oxidoreductase [Glycomyces luteolus]|uniref:SgcJ/EcaC family oxidoreductase n=1 Tax=Glycomyces luteolus TaxID=2670330 RepID=A0A9X3T571_9ACTN|nr:SgcJ/EcaC family oxidoreductase [Glycomyces luteolus]MDA1361840.1 SgcJ/EcaC family oxidoreductase [Glycomyces luteolus]